MKTVRIYQTGGPDVLNYEDAPEPSPAPGHALVEIKSIGVNYTDVSSRKGTNPPDAFPWTPGREGAGVVTATGEGVAEVAVGDRVAYAMHTGSYSEVHSVPSWLLVRIPDGMDFATAAATMLQGMTAHFLVYGIASLNTGDRVLVHAGAGGMGLWLIQMLKNIGVYVHTTVSTEERRPRSPAERAPTMSSTTRSRTSKKKSGRTPTARASRWSWTPSAPPPSTRACAYSGAAATWPSTDRPAAPWERWTAASCVAAPSASPAPASATSPPHATNSSSAPPTSSTGSRTARSSSTWASSSPYPKPRKPTVS